MPTLALIVCFLLSFAPAQPPTLRVAYSVYGAQVFWTQPSGVDAVLLERWRGDAGWLPVAVKRGTARSYQDRERPTQGERWRAREFTNGAGTYVTQTPAVRLHWAILLQVRKR